MLLASHHHLLGQMLAVGLLAESMWNCRVGAVVLTSVFLHSYRRLLANLYNGNVYIWNYNDSVGASDRAEDQAANSLIVCSVCHIGRILVCCQMPAGVRPYDASCVLMSSK